MVPIFTGYDARESIGWHAFTASVIQNTQDAVAFIPLYGRSDGTNAFTRARFMVPCLQKYKGFAIFADASDMICRADISELWDMQDHTKAVQVVKHDYKTKHPRKYIGTAMEADNVDYSRKNWASLMLINCEHKVWADTAKLVETPTLDLLQFRHIPDNLIGELPVAWNWLCQECGPNPDAKIVHYSVGIPGFPYYRDTDMADAWVEAAQRVTYASI